MTTEQQKQIQHISPALLAVMLKTMTLENIIHGAILNKRDEVLRANNIWNTDPEATAYDLE